MFSEVLLIIPLCLVILVRDYYDRLEPFGLMSYSGKHVFGWVLAHLRGESDEYGRHEAAYIFCTTVLPRMFYNA